MREGRDLAQADVARLTGVAQSRISKVELGFSAFDLIDLELVLKCYGFTFEQLLRPFTKDERTQIAAQRAAGERWDEDDPAAAETRRRRTEGVRQAGERLRRSPTD
jgi:transcriptional regulator with XRE-family HTH domain